MCLIFAVECFRRFL